MNHQEILELWKTAAAGDLEQLLEKGHMDTGFHFVLGDPILSVLAACCGTNTGEWKWEDYIREGYAPSFKESVQFAEELRVSFCPTREGWVGTLPGSRYSHLILDLRTEKGNRFHLAAAASSRSALSARLDYLDVLSEAVLMLLNRYETDTNRRLPMELFLSRLLEGSLSDEEMIRSRANLMDFPAEGIFSLLVVNLQGFIPKKDTLATIIERLSRPVRSASAVHDSFLVLLQVFTSERELAAPKLNRDLTACLKENGLTAARSRNFFSLWDIPYHYRQALQMHRLIFLAGADFLLTYEHLAIYMLADSLPEEEKRESACHPVVRELLRLDRTNHFGYLETIDAYLRCSQKAALACKKLHIHRNTLDYRLKKIEDQVPIDWTDGNLMQQIYFSIQLLKVSGIR